MTLLKLVTRSSCSCPAAHISAFSSSMVIWRSTGTTDDAWRESSASLVAKLSLASCTLVWQPQWENHRCIPNRMYTETNVHLCRKMSSLPLLNVEPRYKRTPSGKKTSLWDDRTCSCGHNFAVELIRKRRHHETMDGDENQYTGKRLHHHA